jgi:peptidyl-dipeptidase A
VTDGIRLEVERFLDEHSARFAERMRVAYAAYWEAATTGDPEAAERFARAEAALKKLHADPHTAARVRGWLADAAALEPQVQRQLKLLDLQFTGNLLPDPTIDDLSRRAAELERIFTTFRAEVDGERVTDNRILEILREERDGERRRTAWEASKQVGREVAEPLRELVRRRNAAARSLGFRDHYQMGLALQEQDETHLFALLERFEERSEAAFRALRQEVDRRLADRFGVAAEDLRPWHWEDPFAQQAPAVGEVDLDRHFADRDLVELSRCFFDGIGLPVDDVLARSDLWEREGKNQHAFCLDLDREGDVRVLCNLRATEFWAMVLLHELGHAVYDSFVPRSLPFLLRGPAHTLSTEALAMYMGRLTTDPQWLADNLGVDLGESECRDIHQQLRLKMLVAARWMLVMVHFERELYRDPDRPDLNRLWWDLVERFQGIRRPDGRDEPDWAAKIHFAIAPVYYHNYLLGEWMTSQLTAYIDRHVLRGAPVTGRPEVGEFFRTEVFALGASLDWNALLVAATGEGLNPEHFVEQFVGEEREG